MGDLSANFSRAEFKCKCGNCEQVGPDPELVDVLQKMRDYFGKPVTINSGHRCKDYNKRIGGASKSRHIKGDAADVTVQHVTPSRVQSYLLRTYPGKLGIGCYVNFTHVDTRPYVARWDNRW